MTQDHEYYVSRERQERDTAARCDDKTARRAHLEMAERYSDKLREMADDERSPA